MINVSISEVVIAAFGMFISYELMKKLSTNIEKMRLLPAIKQAATLASVILIFAGLAIVLLLGYDSMRPVTSALLETLKARTTPTPTPTPAPPDNPVPSRNSAPKRQRKQTNVQPNPTPQTVVLSSPAQTQQQTSCVESKPQSPLAPTFSTLPQTKPAVLPAPDAPSVKDQPAGNKSKTAEEGCCKNRAPVDEIEPQELELVNRTRPRRHDAPTTGWALLTEPWLAMAAVA
jgi:hypothetical protein